MNVQKEVRNGEMTKEAEVWGKLSTINVNEHVKEKNRFSYLSWTWAWATLQEHYPNSTYKFKPDMVHADGSVEVWVELTVEGITREMWLAVTDFKNKAVNNPSCDLVANARMRCLVKSIAMFGLGHYIYAGESLPMEVEVELSVDILDQFKGCKSLDEVKAVWASIDKTHQHAYKDIAGAARKRVEK
jgi:hypothetical protein